MLFAADMPCRFYAAALSCHAAAAMMRHAAVSLRRARQLAAMLLHANMLLHVMRRGCRSMPR